jgi:ribokinase
MKKILVIGSVNVDFVCYVDKMPTKGETLIASDFHKGPGGKGNNLACNLNTLGCEVNLLGAIGKDDNGNFLKQEMIKRGLSLSLLVELDNTPTGMAFITVDSKADNTIVVSSGANSMLGSHHVSEEILSNHSVICGSLENPLEMLIEVFQRSNKLGVMTVLNYSPSFEVSSLLFEYTDIFVSNKREFEKVATFYGVSNAADFQQKFKCKAVIITLGKTGVIYSQDEKEVFLSGFYIDNVVDTAGAGDFFLAGFMAGFTRGLSIEESIDIGQKGGAMSVTHKGTQHNIAYDEILGCP